MTEIELEMENDTELRIECEQIYIMDDYEQLKNKPRLNGKEKYLRNSNNTVMAHIGRLREKLNEPSKNPKFIKTVWGVGYEIE